MQEHLRLAFDGTGRLALPSGSLPAEGAVPLSSIVWAWLGCFVSLCIFGLAEVQLAARGIPFLVGSFGTISVLYFGVGLKAPVLRPWNVVVGHVIAGCCACACLALVQPIWLARAVALASTVAFMLWTGSIHPPGGALVMLLMESARFQALGPLYVLYPGLFGSLLLFAASAATDEMKRRFVFTSDDVARLFGRSATLKTTA